MEVQIQALLDSYELLEAVMGMLGDGLEPLLTLNLSNPSMYIQPDVALL